jgi:hypothetical protein
VKLAGDHDVLGDGSVTLKAASGHTPRRQVLAVKTGVRLRINHDREANSAIPKAPAHVD